MIFDVNKPFDHQLNHALWFFAATVACYPRTNTQVLCNKVIEVIVHRGLIQEIIQLSSWSKTGDELYSFVSRWSHCQEVIHIRLHPNDVNPDSGIKNSRRLDTHDQIGQHTAVNQCGPIREHHIPTGRLMEIEGHL